VHGAAWTFVVWGAAHGLGLIATRDWRERHRSSRLLRPLAVLLTFHFVCLGWVFFRAPSFAARRRS